MSNFSEKQEFHIPFIKELVFVGLVTLVSMISVHYYLTSSLEIPNNTPIINYAENQIDADWLVSYIISSIFTANCIKIHLLR